MKISDYPGRHLIGSAISRLKKVPMAQFAKELTVEGSFLQLLLRPQTDVLDMGYVVHFTMMKQTTYKGFPFE